MILTPLTKKCLIVEKNEKGEEDIMKYKNERETGEYVCSDDSLCKHIKTNI